MLAFFSGYPMVYYLVRFFVRHASLKNVNAGPLVSILPFAYALIGTIYLGLQLINLYSVHNYRKYKATDSTALSDFLGVAVFTILDSCYFQKTDIKRLSRSGFFLHNSKGFIFSVSRIKSGPEHFKK